MQRCFPGHYYTHKLCKSTGFKTVLKRHLDVLLAADNIADRIFSDNPRLRS